ncbi:MULTISPECIES: hypothetical protein [Methanoculleus]|jgi:hypothetical protein|uniref:Uncharacterized protein n=1 Tax=Methanoculleus thermophilus TaxID=2200 RepID=A0A1G8Y6R2_9EURY|nr:MULTISPECIES: hypothetical protein [Methanoculleus]NLN09820.1 hypothetical protein [Methanoculleus thermophilus]SDJ98528.1 hypothetical protein SAMN04488571_102256 [Methanoculleus thermophilus]HQD25861.1 hypothetical protein [Methanoculleus thermophilus]
MKYHDLILPGVVLVSTCIIIAGALIGAQTFAVPIPFTPYIMVILAALVVIGATMLVLSSRSLEVESPQR